MDRLAVERAAPDQGTGPPFAGRYALQRVLKSGNGVETHLAVDGATGQSVVVKLIDPSLVHGAARLRFVHETQVLRTLQGLGLPGLHDSGESDGRLFLVQPFLSGSTVEQLLRAGPLPLETVLRIGVDVAAALDLAHGAGVCHRDVKPANILVDGPDDPEQVTLIDFGFARSPWLDESIRDELVGTVRYLAPESSGLLAAAADERSDLYALGVVLFECLAGRPPYPGPTVGDLLRQHLSAPVPLLRDAGVSAPRAVDAVLQRLLRKEPSERYQSAAAVAADLGDLLAAVRAGETNPRIVIGRLDRRRTLTDPTFVGREAELDELSALVRATAGGEGGLVLLEAESGGGKSRLLAEVTQQADSLGVTVLRGQGVALVGQRPFTMLHGVADDLVAALAHDEPARHRLAAEVAASAPTIVRALPSLHGLLGVEPGGVEGPEQFGEQRSLAALQHLLTTVSSAQRPVLLLLDDCQWADTLTIRLLASLFATAGGQHLGVIAAFRSEEVPPGAPLREIPGAHPVHLGPLSDRAVEMLAQSMAGPIPAEAVHTVVRLADGSPFMAAAVLRGLVEAGALLDGPDGWTVDRAALRDVQTARRSAAFLVRRLELLEEEAISLLSVGAVLGKEFDVDTAVRLAGNPPSAPAAIEDARRRRLLWIDERTGRCSFFHDKIREALLERLDDNVRRMLHSTAADGLAATPGASVFDLAYHYDAAGRPAEALPYALAGAELARSLQALDNAVLHYRMAERTVQAEDVGTRARIAEGLGDLLTLQGVYAEAEAQLELARSLVTDTAHAAAIEGKRGDLAFKQGDIPTAKRRLEGAVAGLGRPVPRWTVVVVVRLVWELLVQAMHTLLPRLTVGRRSPEGREIDFLTMRLYSRLAYLYWFHSGKVPCAWVHLREMNLAERYPPSAELGQAYSEHAPVMTMIPWYSRGITYARRSLDIRRALDDGWGQGQSLGFAAVVLFAAGRWDEAQDAAEAAVRQLERTGDQWEVNTAAWHRALCLYRKGRLAEAAAAAQDVYAAADAIGDLTSRGIGLSIWTRARLGEVDRSLIDAQLDQGNEDAHTGCELLLASALQLHRAGALDRASEELDKARALVRRAGLRQEYVAPVYPWQATVLRQIAEQSPQHRPDLRRRRLRAARRATWRARFWAATYRNNAPHALREAGLVCSLRGRRGAADRLLARSLRIAQAQGAAYEIALTRHALAEVAVAGGAPEEIRREAVAEVFELEQAALAPAVTEAEARTTVSLFDRFTTLLKVGRTITAATSFAAVEAGVREAALSLLRGERCHLIPVSHLSHDELTTQSGESVDEVSRTLLARAVEAGAPIAADATSDDSESLLLSTIRSVLAAPISVHGEPVSCFYVTHRQIGRLFGEEEVQLAAFIATLAGAAFEHLAGNEARFRSLAQNSSDVITLIDADGLVTYQSAAAVTVFGNTGSVIGRRVREWAHPDDLEAFERAIEAARSHQGIRIECRLRHADGSYRYAETAVTDLLDEPTVAAVVLNTRDVTDRHQLEAELRERALHDALTGLPNRALFHDRALQALERSARDPMPLCVAFMDLDDFKAINDTFGHAVGDELLCTIAERLMRCVRPTDTVTRLGGDEFAVLLESTDLSTGIGVVQRMLEAVAEPMMLGDTEVVIRASIGLTCVDGQPTDPNQLLAHADTAMYAAKARGTHGFELFVPAMQEATEARLALRMEIDRALVREEFRVHYQPIIDARTHATVSMEALVRWEHPQRGMLSPHEFIDFAENSGQIVEMGRWVLAQACVDAAALGPAAHVSVNVSARQLQDAGLVDDVRVALLRSGIAPHQLTLEITETAAMADTGGTIARLHELKALGLQLALDDFGTGYSPLSYLRKFPVDLLKIDRSFVTEIVHSAADRSIVKGVIEMAHALDLRAVAEGVETPEQLAVLLELGCDLGQGYLWMRPGPLEQVADRPAVPGPRLPVTAERIEPPVA